MGAMIYLDYAAATPLDARVGEAMRRFGREVFGNPSSLHGAGRAARAAIDAARDGVAEMLNARSSEILFTSGGTESDNLAIKGVAQALKSRGTHIITTAIEHHAVLESCLALEREGFRVTVLQPDAEGFITARQVEEAITPETMLVSVMYANNEIGTIEPLAEIGAVCRARRVVLHTDAVQGAGELDLDVRRLLVDLLSLSAHKVYGPTGVGALYVRSGTRLQPLFDGGGQEHERRAGTENTAGIVGFAEALRLARDHAEHDRIRAQRDRLIDGLLAIPDAHLHGSRDHRLSNNVNVGFPGVSGETLLLALDLEGIAVSTGSACAAGAVEPSHVLQAIGHGPAQAQEALRLSLGRFTTDAEIARVITVMRDTVARLRKHDPHYPHPPQEGCSS